jgi:hypothetical protein
MPRSLSGVLEELAEFAGRLQTVMAVGTAEARVVGRRRELASLEAFLAAVSTVSVGES